MNLIHRFLCLEFAIARRTLYRAVGCIVVLGDRVSI